MRRAWSLGASRRRHSKEFRRDLPRVVICSQGDGGVRERRGETEMWGGWVEDLRVVMET